MREAKGLTTRLVPITISRSASPKSSGTRCQKRGGRFSPKNTMSGFTRPPQPCSWWVMRLNGLVGGQGGSAGAGGRRQAAGGVGEEGCQATRRACSTWQRRPASQHQIDGQPSSAISSPPPPTPTPPPHLLYTVARVSVPHKHRLPHMLHRVRPLALDALGAVKVAVGSHHRLGGQPRLVLQGIDVLQIYRGWQQEARVRANKAGQGKTGRQVGRLNTMRIVRRLPLPRPRGTLPCPVLAWVKQRSSRPLSCSRRMKWWVGVGR